MSATPNLLHSSRVHERHAELLKLDAEHLRLRILALETGMDEGEIKAILATPSADKSTSVGADFKEEVTSEGCEESPGKVGSKRQRTSGQGTETTPASENKSTETSSQQTGSVPKPPKYSSKSVAADSSTASSAVKVEKARPAGVSKKDSAMGVDWTKVRRRRIALKIAYVGDRYAGFAAQVSHPTVESELFTALTKVALIPDPRLPSPLGPSPLASAPTPANFMQPSSNSIPASAAAAAAAAPVSPLDSVPDSGHIKPISSFNGVEIAARVSHSSNYTRCGRTDRGVNARTQVIAIDVRSSLPCFQRQKKESKDSKKDNAAKARASSTTPSPGTEGADAAEVKDDSTSTSTSSSSTSSSSTSSSSTSSSSQETSAAPTVAADPDPRVKGLLPLGCVSSATYTGFANRRFTKREETGEDYAQNDGEGDEEDDGGEGGDVKSDAMADADDDGKSNSNSPVNDDEEDDANFDWELDNQECDYVAVLNRALPDDIRVLAWAPVSLKFSARFSCEGRAYKYFFYHDGMDLEAMHKAAQYVVGSHDFRNLCRMDIVNLAHFRRRILAASVGVCDARDNMGYDERSHINARLAATAATAVTAGTAGDDTAPISSTSSSSSSSLLLKPALPSDLETIPLYTYHKAYPYGIAGHVQIHTEALAVGSASSGNAATTALACIAPSSTSPSPSALISPNTLCEVTIVGEAFLYHQVRCIVAALFMVGRGLEKPEIVKDLLDLNKYPSKPCYEMAPDAPLVLWDAFYAHLRWRVSQKALTRLMGSLHASSRKLDIQARIYEAIHRSLLPTARTLPPGPWSAETRSKALCKDTVGGKVERSQTLMDFVHLVPHSATSAAIPLSLKRITIFNKPPPVENDFLARVTPSFSPYLPGDGHLLRLYGCMSYQSIVYPASRIAEFSLPTLQQQEQHEKERKFQAQEHIRLKAKTPFYTAESVCSLDSGVALAFPYHLSMPHIPINKRLLEPTLNEKLDGLTGKKAMRKQQCEAFSEWLRTNGAAK